MKRLISILVVLSFILSCSPKANNDTSELNSVKTLSNQSTRIEKLEMLLGQVDLKKVPFVANDKSFMAIEGIAFDYANYITGNEELLGDILETLYRLPSHQNFYLLFVNFSNNGNFTNMLTISNRGEIIDQKEVYAFYGNDEEKVTVISKFLNNRSFTITTRRYLTNQGEDLEEVEETKCKIDNQGKISVLGTNSHERRLGKMKQFIIDGDGVAGLKIGMSLDEIEEQLPDMGVEHRTISEGETDFYVLKSFEIEVCSFEIDLDDKVFSIHVDNDRCKTELGIGLMSTMSDIKKAYKSYSYVIGEGAEGIPKLYLKVEKYPNIKFELDYLVPDDYYLNDAEIYKKVPLSTNVIGVYIEQ